MRKETYQFKVIGARAGERRVVEGGEEVRRLQVWEDFEGPRVEVLGLPVGGHVEGRDAYGETFTRETAIWMEVGDMVPVTYYHGFGPDDPMGWQDPPVAIGRAELVRVDEAGFWFEARLDLREELAQRVWEALAAGREVRASSGAVGHLVRVNQAGVIEVWPVGEIAVFDTNEWRRPANELAIVRVLEESDSRATGALAEGVKAAEGLGTGEAAEAPEAAMVEGTAEAMGECASINFIDEIGAEAPEVMEMEELDFEKLAESLAEKAAAAAVAAVEAKFGERRESGGLVAPNLNLRYGAGDPDPVEDFLRWVRTGESQVREHTVKAELPIGPDRQMVKAAMQEGTTTEGGYYVPAGVLGRIIEKRQEMGLLDQLPGVNVFTTNSYVLPIPSEGTAMTRFTIVAEEGAITDAENEPTADQDAVTLYNFKKLIKISEELLEDENSGLEAYLERAIGSAWAITENYYIQLGSGSGQPQGVFVGGTAGLTLDSATSIGASEIPELMGKLKMAYRPGAVMIMNRTTGAYLAGLTGNQFVFRTTNTTPLMAGASDLGIGYPVFLTEDAPQIQASAKSLLFGNFAFYGWVRNRGLRVRRLTELYAGNGQIGILANFRAGGAVLQAEAFQYATHPTG